MAHLLDLTKHLCGSCTMDMSYCPADSEDVDYGTAIGADNITSCPYYEASSHVLSDVEVIEDMPKAKTN